MNTKREIIEKIGFLIAGGDNTADLRDRYHPNVIEAVVMESMDAMLQNAFRQSSSKKGTGNYALLDNYTKTYPNPTIIEVPVLLNTDRNEHYSVLPVKVIVLDDNAGIRMICNLRDQSNAYFKMSATENSVYAHLSAGKIKSESRYYPERDTVFYEFTNPNAIPEKVMMKLVPSFVELSDEDVIDETHIIGKDGFMSLTDRVVGILRGMPPTKTTNDNTTKNV